MSAEEDVGHMDVAKSSLQVVRALMYVKEQFPGEPLYEVRLEACVGERSDFRPLDCWSGVSWRVQVGNDVGHGESLVAAIGKLRENLLLKATVSEKAERLAALLREVPDDNRHRELVISAAQGILERERLEQRRQP